MLKVLQSVWLLSLMSGLMGAWRIRSLVHLHLVQGFFTDRSGHLWADHRWGHLDDDVGGNMVIGSCRGFCSLPGPLQTLQRAEFWDVILALQAADGIHLGVVILVLYVMSVACWMAMLALVLLNLLRMVI